MIVRIKAQDIQNETQAWFARLRDALSGKNRYHPEKHYMRGPGPKTLAKLGAAGEARQN